MFDQVPNQGGRASCQDDYTTFQLMRQNQYAFWTEDMLTSYAQDLQKAHADGRNLLTEKYARMMASTHPDEYATFQAILPPISAEAALLIEKITAAHVSWKKTVNARYPHLADNGWPLSTAEDSAYQTSFETYLRGELSTYSLQTLQLYAAFIDECYNKGRNLALENLQDLVTCYGFASLEEAEQKQALSAS